MVPKRFLTSTIILFFVSNALFSQERTAIITKADSAHVAYRFEEAISLYDSVLINTPDSLLRISLEEKKILCENGISLLQYAVTPNVLTSTQVPIEDFYLYFSNLRDSSWVKIPNALVSQAEHPLYSSIYLPSETNKHYFSAPDNSGSWNIYVTEWISGSLWSEPRLLNESITSAGDEIFPILSSDGKELYFASNGQYGMGGFDLYVSHWDDELEEWGIPENLGFPYSSTGNDVFFMNTPDGQYTMIASDRNSPKDSIAIYVMEYTPTPIKKTISEIDQVQLIAKLSTPKPTTEEAPEETAVETPDLVNNEEMNRYSELISNMRALRSDLQTLLDEIQATRELYEKSEDENEKASLSQKIILQEERAMGLQSGIDEAAVKVQTAEMNFLTQGIIPTFNETSEEESVEEEPLLQYTFSKLNFATAPLMEIEKPAPKFDYSFQILDQAQFAENDTLPNTLVYQIQIFVTSRPATVANLKGLSPVFEKRLSSGKYLYAAGLFYSHSEALSCLNKVRKRGFPKAFIIAYNNGKSISIKSAKALEASQKEEASYQLLIYNYPDGLPISIITAIRESCDKDIAKSVIEGQTVYIVGPFARKDGAESVQSLLEGLGIENLSVEPVKL